MDLEQLLSGGMNMPVPGKDVPTMDTSETVQISSLALLKMLKHGTARRGAAGGDGAQDGRACRWR